MELKMKLEIDTKLPRSEVVKEIKNYLNMALEVSNTQRNISFTEYSLLNKVIEICEEVLDLNLGKY